MSSINRHLIVGHLGRDPVHSNEPNRAAMTGFSVATKMIYRDSEGKKIEHTEWHNVVCFDRRAMEAKEYRSGDEVMVEGYVQTRTYTNAKNETKQTKEIVAETCKLIDKSRRVQRQMPPSNDSHEPKAAEKSRAEPETALY